MLANISTANGVNKWHQSVVSPVCPEYQVHLSIFVPCNTFTPIYFVVFGDKLPCRWHNRKGSIDYYTTHCILQQHYYRKTRLGFYSQNYRKGNKPKVGGANTVRYLQQINNAFSTNNFLPQQSC